uniref:Uncharacterized protein n=1 Tax=Meloidogyne incognita TaxID=6306 RepID=A0A914MN27_MELIC
MSSQPKAVKLEIDDKFNDAIQNCNLPKEKKKGRKRKTHKQRREERRERWEAAEFAKLRLYYGHRPDDDCIGGVVLSTAATVKEEDNGNE